jgi:CRP/FNR family transcriptional regulator
VKLPAGAHAFDPGQNAEAFLIVLSGRVRVQLTAASGREIVLYRVEAGESCVLTTSCLIEAEAYAAGAICETDVEALAVPRPSFERLLDSSAAFRKRVLGAYASRVADLILTIEESQFRRLDARLAGLLAAQAPSISATHQELATELGSAREAVSRLLKRFERAGWIALNRGEIEVRQPAALQAHAQLS